MRQPERTDTFLLVDCLLLPFAGGLAAALLGALAFLAWHMLRASL